VEDRFPQIWVPSWENRDVRQLLWHRHRLVQMRTRIMNQLQAVALNEGLRCKKRLWRERGRQQLESFLLAPWASRRRRDLLELLDRLNPTIAELSQAIEQQAERCPAAQRLMTHPGVGALTALAFVLIIGEAERFGCGKQIAAYLGLVPEEGFQWGKPTAGTYQQARQRADAFLPGGSGAGHGTERRGVATKVFPLSAATWTKDRQGGDGAQTGSSFVLDVASAMGLRAMEEIQSARGPARNRRWCAVEHRAIDWAARSPFTGEFELAIMIEIVGSKRCMGRTEFRT